MNRDFGGPTRLGMIVIGVVFFLIVAGLFYFITGGSRNDGMTAEERSRREVTQCPQWSQCTHDGLWTVVANEDRQSYEVTVSSSSRRFAAYTGYNQSQVESKDFDNTTEGYQQFVYALARAGFDRERSLSEEAADDRGACSAGKRYVYELIENGDVVKRVWTSTCGNAKGTFAGTNNIVRDLFNKQIPEFRTSCQTTQSISLDCTDHAIIPCMIRAIVFDCFWDTGGHQLFYVSQYLSA